MNIQLPLTKDVIQNLKAGDTVYLSGVLFTARDAAHKRMAESMAAGEELPFDIEDRPSITPVHALQSQGKLSAPAVQPPVAVWTNTLLLFWTRGFVP